MIYGLFAVVVTIVWTALCFVLVLITMLTTFSANPSIWIARRMWAPVLSWVGGGQVEVEGQENVVTSRPTVYVSNHQSTLDIPVLFMAIDTNLRFIAKTQLKWVPFVGWYMQFAKHIFVDRADSKQAISSLDEAARRIQQGISIIVFPEGTRSEDGRILPFKKGPFALALKAGCAVCPVTIEGSCKVMPKNSWAIKPGPVKVKIGKPIDASQFGATDREGLMRAVRDAIIDQSVQLGGKGGDKTDTIAQRGMEGIGKAHA